MRLPIPFCQASRRREKLPPSARTRCVTVTQYEWWLWPAGAGDRQYDSSFLCVFIFPPAMRGKEKPQNLRSVLLPLQHCGGRGLMGASVPWLPKGPMAGMASPWHRQPATDIRQHRYLTLRLLQGCKDYIIKKIRDKKPNSF